MATPWKSNPTMHAWIVGLASVEKLRPSKAFAAWQSAAKFFPDWPPDMSASAVRKHFEVARTGHKVNGTMTKGTISTAVAGLESATDPTGFQELIKQLDEQPAGSSQPAVQVAGVVGAVDDEEVVDESQDEDHQGLFRPIDGLQSPVQWKPNWVCATPGCYLSDFHEEPCTPMLPSGGKRKRTQAATGNALSMPAPIRPMPAPDTPSTPIRPMPIMSTVQTPPVYRAPTAPVAPTASPAIQHTIKPTPVGDRKHPQLYDMYTEADMKAFYETMGNDGTLISMSTFLDMSRDGTISSTQIVTMLSIACQRIMIADKGKSGFFNSGFHPALDAIGREVIDRGQRVAPKPYVSVLLMILPKNHTASDYAFYEEMRRRIALLIVGMLHQRREMDDKLPNSSVSSKQVLLYETAGFQLAFLDTDTPDIAMLIAPGFLGVGSHPQSEDASTFSEAVHKTHHGVTAEDPHLKIRHDSAWKLMGGMVSNDGKLQDTKGMVRVEPLEEIRQSLSANQSWPKDEEYMTLNGLAFNLVTILECAHYDKYRYMVKETKSVR